MLLHILCIYCSRKEFVIRQITAKELQGQKSEGSDAPPATPMYLTLNLEKVNDDLKFINRLNANARWFLDKDKTNPNNKYVAIHSKTKPDTYLSLDENDETGLVGLLSNSDDAEHIVKNAIWRIIPYDADMNVVDTKKLGHDADIIKFHKIELEDKKLCLSCHKNKPHVEVCKDGDTDQMFKITKVDSEDDDEPIGDPEKLAEETSKNDGDKNKKEQSSSGDPKKSSSTSESGKNNGDGNKNQSGNGSEQGKSNNGESSVVSAPGANVTVSITNPESESAKDSGSQNNLIPPVSSGVRVEGGDNKEEITLETEKKPYSYMASSLVKTTSDVVHMVHSCTTTETVLITSTISTTKTSIVLITSTTIIELTKTFTTTPTISYSVKPVIVTSSTTSTLLSTVAVEMPPSDTSGKQKPKIECPEPAIVKPRKRKHEFTTAVSTVKRRKPNNLFDELNCESDSSISSDSSDECEEVLDLYKNFEDIKGKTIDHMEEDLNIPDFLKEVPKPKHHTKKVRQTSTNLVCNTAQPNIINQKNHQHVQTAQPGQYLSYPYDAQQQTPQPGYYQVPAVPIVQQGQSAYYASISCNPIAKC